MCDKIGTYPGPSVLSLALFNPSNPCYSCGASKLGRGERKKAERESELNKYNK